MKFIDLINEEIKSFKKEDPAEEKRARTIFKALRKGVVKVQHPRTNEIIKFRYYINDPVFYKWEYYMSQMELTIITYNIPGEGITIYCDDKDVVDKCTNNLESVSKNPTGIHLREMFMNKLKNRFGTFNVKIHINEPGIKFVLDEPKNELNESNEGELIRKGKLIFKALRKGTIGSDENPNRPKFSYELSDDMSVSLHNDNIIIFTPEVKIVELNKECGTLSADYMARKINNRFKQFKVTLSHPKLDYHNVDSYYERNKREGVNEQNISRREPTKEQNKRAKIFYDAFKTGKFTVEGDRQPNEHGGTYKYVLPDEYWTTIDDDGELCVILTMNPEQTMEMYYTHKDHQTGEIIEKYINRLNRKHLYQWMVDSIKRKFKQFQINIIF
jgi:hypothetical protein